jgi:hypothetical protein
MSTLVTMDTPARLLTAGRAESEVNRRNTPAQCSAVIGVITLQLICSVRKLAMNAGSGTNRTMYLAVVGALLWCACLGTQYGSLDQSCARLPADAGGHCT